MGAMITQRPVCSAPWFAPSALDMLRYQNFQIAKLWVPEYARDDFQSSSTALRLSPYHHVKAAWSIPPSLYDGRYRHARRSLHAKKNGPLMQAEAKNGASKISPSCCASKPKAGHGQEAATKQIERARDMYSFFILADWG